MKAVVKKKRPHLSQKHRRERMDFAIRYKDWTLDDWKKVVWSDETKINYLGSDSRKWAWKRAGEGLSDRLVEGIVKFGGGSVMVWGCMLWDGPGYACKIDGRMDGDLSSRFWMMNFKKLLLIMAKLLRTSSFSKIMTLNIPAKRPKNGSKIMDSLFYNN